MLRIRNDRWKHDLELRECLKTYVARSLKRHEIIDLVQDKFHEYSWSLGSLDRRMAFWGIKYIDNTIDISRLRNVIQEELQGPGRLLSQKAMHQKVRQIHHLNVPRDLVCSVMQELLDDSGLDETYGVGKPKRPRRKRNFHSEHFVNGQQDPTSAPHYSQVTRPRQPRKTRSKVSKKSKTSRVSIKSEQVEDETSEENTSNSKMIQTENIVEAATG
ncbi:hypothetical protein SNE40_017495 [Patella caerulea]|uniref:Uncharacterized protein n=1 Tax=Patella caerulea TaxID=87958 RepID=A0AAN8JAI2_PATCE